MQSAQGKKANQPPTAIDDEQPKTVLFQDIQDVMAGRKILPGISAGLYFAG